MNIETELVGNEITHLKPRSSKLRDFADAVAGALLIVAVTIVFLWIAAHSF